MPPTHKTTASIAGSPAEPASTVAQFPPCRAALSFHILRILLLALPVPWLCGAASGADNYPSWWYDRGVVTNSAVTNDFAALNAGCVKWMAAKACDELNENLPGGAGSNVQNLVQGFLNTNNFHAVNVGQLKNVAQPFYDRLIEVGYTNSYPWTVSTNDDCDYAVANIGQLKCLFSFQLPTEPDADSDGLPDSVETGTGIFVSPADTGSDPNVADSDDDGADDGDEVAQRTDPNNDDTTVPSVEIGEPANGATWLGIP